MLNGRLEGDQRRLALDESGGLLEQAMAREKKAARLAEIVRGPDNTKAQRKPEDVSLQPSTTVRCGTSSGQTRQENRVLAIPVLARCD